MTRTLRTLELYITSCELLLLLSCCHLMQQYHLALSAFGDVTGSASAFTLFPMLIPFDSNSRCDDDTHYTITTSTFQRLRLQINDLLRIHSEIHMQYEEETLGVGNFLLRITRTAILSTTVHIPSIIWKPNQSLCASTSVLATCPNFLLHQIFNRSTP